ncbi:beta-propeller domain-containing protein [Petroclostridium sp. X23]|uniref:beta-propeller domain-containing protein n=1 Tax=Petroclostridium sp. X23 TaxID=3045146 RepID=UPI0024AE4916|nr:beta-propeller domain-containing protein [Petroclostridium sp. X23]WHH59377.1 beta-propeller domain-containing protein [Petroclostridium sp. X23]
MKKISIIICVLLIVAAVISTQQINVGFSMTDGSSTAINADNKSNSLEEIIRERISDAIVLYIGSPKANINNQLKDIDTANPEVYPMVKEGRALVPVRFISESLSANVDWNENTSEIKISLGSKDIRMILGSKIMKVNDKTILLEVPAEEANGRTLVPLRALAEALDKKVFYDRGLIVISDREKLFDVNTDKALLDKIIARVNVLPAVGSYEKLTSLIEEAKNHSGYRHGEMEVSTAVALDTLTGAAPEAKKEAAPVSGSKTSDYSTTNIQVQGVDEADIVKTDGEYIYQVNKQRIVVAKAYPADQLNVVSTIAYGDQNFNPIELYLDDKHLVVIGSAYDKNISDYPAAAKKKASIIRPDVEHTVKAIIYDISDKENIRSIREVELDGQYVTSRKIGTALYFITNKYLNYYYIQQQPEKSTPRYRDTAIGNSYINVDYKDIQYIPKFENPNYLIIAGLNLDKSDEKIKVSTYLGVSKNVYVSNDNMYIGVTSYNTEKDDMIRPYVYQQLNTLVYKFSLNDGSITYLSKGEVPGTVLNQFSMDESKDYFRIATTKGDEWRNDEYTSKNNVYVLDETLNIVGKLEDVAPGEKIYSVRFMGDRAYVVTFKKVDPLFVIDLKNPKKPSILGALKIPGYSDYLHPYDENHIIGFGKDTVELSTGAFYQGLKMALFDVSDVNNPKEKFAEYIGDRGTDSELLRNHKALLFSKEKNLLAFPVTLKEARDTSEGKHQGFPQYGEFTFQGAYIYNIGIENGFRLKGRITHLTEEDYLKSGNYWYNSERNVERILYIDDIIYTLSKGMIKANNMSDLKEKKAVIIQ